ncbi:DUF134 domain-containing protein [Desulfovibrionales bacterium]
MGRRRKCRFVAEPPEITLFKPAGVPMRLLRGVVIGLDGLEALRLVDAEGLSQEDAAQRMGVSRPTLCRILALARTQVAKALSRGWAIRIEVDQPEVSHEPSQTPTQGGRSCPDKDNKDVEETQ